MPPSVKTYIAALALFSLLALGCTTQQKSEANVVIGENASREPTLKELIDAVDRSCFYASGSAVGSDYDCFVCIKTIAANYNNKALCAKVTQCYKDESRLFSPEVCEAAVDEESR
ncbi:MAG: hypothetical protein AB1468_01410 [Candidatus Micrarchaeota archaeon]